MAETSVTVPWKSQLKTYAYSRRPMPAVDPGRFLIFGQGRTGSNLLGSLLANHPQVHFANEVLFDQMLLPQTWIEGGRRRNPAACYGIHVKIYQLRDEHRVRDVNAWLHGMHERGWKIVYLRRENLLRHVLSNMLADARGSYHDRDGSVSNPRLEVDVLGLVTHMGLRRQNLLAEAEALAGLPFETVVYEDDLLDETQWQPTVDRLYKHIGLASVPVSSALRRTSSADLASMVANLEEIRPALTALGWGGFIDER